MQKEIRKNLEKIISPKDVLLVGVSGGADSVCLLLVLCALSREMDFSVEAVHVEHGIRGAESIEDAAYVGDLCKGLQVPLMVVSVDVPLYSSQNGLGMEEAARILRYEAFEKLAKEKHAKVALAHHMEDNAETILFQLVRGSSISGLCGMQSVRTNEHGVTYIRPLLSVHRKEIEEYLLAQKILYRTDSTNASLDYSRNYIRNVVLPELGQVNGQAVRHINAAAAQFSEIRDFLEEETKKAWKEVVQKESGLCGKKERHLQLDVEKLNTFHGAVKKELVYRAIAYMRGAKKDISAVHVQDLLELCQNQSGKERHLPGGLIAKKEYSSIKLFYAGEILLENKDNLRERGEDNHICISGKQLKMWKQLKEAVMLPLGDAGEYLQIRFRSYSGKNSKIPQKTYTKWFDYDKIKDGFCIRTSQSGDAFISDAFGHRKKLKRYFIDEKIPAYEREHMWLLAQEQTVLWLIGGRISEHIKVADTTKTIMEITYYGGSEDEC